jgi:peptidyl-prolyl cis-trans isomerase B (cyclophilin B)
MAAYPMYVQPAPPTNGMSIGALVTGILGLAIVPVILGHIALSQIKRTGEQGRGMAIAGLVLGYVCIVAYVVLIVGLVLFGYWLDDQLDDFYY